MSAYDPLDPKNDELTRVLTELLLGGRTQEQVENPVKHQGDPSRDTRTYLSPAQPPRDILGEAMQRGGPPIPWSAGYTGAMGLSPEMQAFIDRLLGDVGNMMEAKGAVGSRSVGMGRRPPGARPTPMGEPEIAPASRPVRQIEPGPERTGGIGLDARVERIPDFPPPTDSPYPFEPMAKVKGLEPEIPEYGGDTLGNSLKPVMDMLPDVDVSQPLSPGNQALVDAMNRKPAGPMPAAEAPASRYEPDFYASGEYRDRLRNVTEEMTRRIAERAKQLTLDPTLSNVKIDTDVRGTPNYSTATDTVNVTPGAGGPTLTHELAHRYALHDFPGEITTEVPDWKLVPRRRGSLEFDFVEGTKPEVTGYARIGGDGVAEVDPALAEHTAQNIDTRAGYSPEEHRFQTYRDVMDNDPEILAIREQGDAARQRIADESKAARDVAWRAEMERVDAGLREEKMARLREQGHTGPTYDVFQPSTGRLFDVVGSEAEAARLAKLWGADYDLTGSSGRFSGSDDVAAMMEGFYGGDKAAGMPAKSPQPLISGSGYKGYSVKRSPMTGEWTVSKDGTHIGSAKDEAGVRAMIDELTQ